MQPIRLSAGNHDSPEQGGCVMEWVSLLAKQPWTDNPTCTNEVITRAAQAVNDRLNDTERQRLVALIPRIMRARRTDSDRRVNVRLALWAARSVLHLTREQDRVVCERAVVAVEMWLAGEATAQECRAAYAAASAFSASASSAYAASAFSSSSSAAAYAAYASAAYAAYASASSAYAAAYAASAFSSSSAAAYAAYAAAAYAAAADPVTWLDSLLDVWEKAINEEGEALWVPTEWEDEALAFLDEWKADAQ
jgi:hypothetical protein